MTVILKVTSGKTLQCGNAPWFYTRVMENKIGSSQSILKIKNIVK